MDTGSLDALRQRIDEIKEDDLRKKALFALDSINDQAKLRIVTDALRALRRAGGEEKLCLARDIGRLTLNYNPGNPYIASELAISLTFLNSPEEVIVLLTSFFDQATAENITLPQSSREFLTVSLAHAYAHVGRVNEGIAALEKLRSDAPNVIEALSELYYQNGESERTISMLDGLPRLTPKMAQWLAKSYMAQGNAEKAGKVLEPFAENPKLREIFTEIMADRVPKLVTPMRFSPSASNFLERTLVFISHASKDAPLARKLVTLLCAALGCKKSDVRCTSVSGSRLPVGADTSNHLANDIIGSPVFIGLLTEDSVQSAYVLFELGASWIMDYSKDGHRTFPVLGGDVSYDILPGPFKTLHAIRTNNRSDIQQMINEIGTVLELPLLAPNYYEDELDELVKYRPPICTA